MAKITFENLWIRSDHYGRIKGSLKIKSSDGSSVEISLPREAMESVVDLCVDELATAATIQADRLREAILERKVTPKKHDQDLQT